MRFWISAVSQERVSSFGLQTPIKNISANFNYVTKKENNCESDNNDGHHDAEDDDDDDDDNLPSSQASLFRAAKAYIEQNRIGIEKNLQK